MSSPLAGAEMMTFFAPAGDSGGVAVGEEAGQLDDHVGAEVAPGQHAGVALGEHLDVPAVYAQRTVRDLDGPGRSRRWSRT